MGTNGQNTDSTDENDSCILNMTETCFIPLSSDLNCLDNRRADCPILTAEDLCRYSIKNT